MSTAPAEQPPRCACVHDNLWRLPCHKCGEYGTGDCWNCKTPRGDLPCPSLDKKFITVTYTEHVTRTATFDVTELYRRNGWDPRGVVGQCSPVDGYHGGKLEDIWWEIHAVQGRIPE